MACMVWLFQMPLLGYGMYGVVVSDAYTGLWHAWCGCFRCLCWAMACMVWLFQMPLLGCGMYGVVVSDAFAGSRTDMTFEVEKQLSI